MFRNRTRSAKRLARTIAEGARRRGEGAKEASKAAYGRLIGVARASAKQAGEVREMLRSAGRLGGEHLAEEIERLEGLVERVVWQTERRVLKGEGVAAGEKLVSIFEGSTPRSSPAARRARRPSSGVRCGLMRWRGAS